MDVISVNLVDGLPALQYKCGRCGKDTGTHKKTCQDCLNKVGQYMAERHQRLKRDSLCTRCGYRPCTGDHNTCTKCADYEVNKNKTRATILIGKNLCRICKLPVAAGRSLCSDHLNKKAANSRLQTLNIRKKIVDHYGGKCICCEEINYKFLSLDHINEDGAAHRRAIQIGSGYRFYKWVIANDYPHYLQLLCYNCNMGKYINNGVCPHTEIK